MLVILLVLFVLLAIAIVSIVIRAMPVIKDSRSFNNTHFGHFIHPSKPSEEHSSAELLKEAASVDLSVVVPAYNEGQRIQPMLDETVEFLEARKKSQANFKYEIVVVNDGSKDDTKDKVLQYSQKHGFDKIRLVNLVRNCGKGAAINKGMRFSRGELILFADADGATTFSGLTGLEKEIKRITKNGLGCVVGSRYINAKEKTAKRTAFRRFISKVFHMLVLFVCGNDIQDTQCGFKLFTRKAAQSVFPSQHVDRWAFDVEVLYLCSRFRVPVGEVQVTWHEIGGSKVTLSGVLGMVRDIALIRLLYAFGI